MNCVSNPEVARHSCVCGSLQPAIPWFVKSRHILKRFRRKLLTPGFLICPQFTQIALTVWRLFRCSLRSLNRSQKRKAIRRFRLTATISGFIVRLAQSSYQHSGTTKIQLTVGSALGSFNYGMHLLRPLNNFGTPDMGDNVGNFFRPAG